MFCPDKTAGAGFSESDESSSVGADFEYTCSCNYLIKGKLAPCQGNSFL